jgi:hypothetical protein
MEVRRRGTLKPKSKWADCPQRAVERGEMTDWNQARKLKVKGKTKACPDCPAREVLG